MCPPSKQLTETIREKPGYKLHVYAIELRNLDLLFFFQYFEVNTCASLFIC